MKRTTWKPPKSYRHRFLEVFGPLSVLGAAGGLVWALRPGGFFDRQPRVGWLIFLGILGFSMLYAGIIHGFFYWILNVIRRLSGISPRPARQIEKRFTRFLWHLLIMSACIAVGAMLWPGGLVKDYPTVPSATDTTPTTLAP